MKSILILISVALFLRFGPDPQKKIQISIEPYKAPQNGAFFKSLSLVSPNSDADFIEGFNFEWGYSYELKIIETKLKYPPEDGSSVAYKLVEVISKTKVAADYRFNMSVVGEIIPGLIIPGQEAENESYFKEINDSTYLYFDEIEMEIPSIFKSDFDRMCAEGRSGKGQFAFIGDNKIRMEKLD